MDSVIRPSNNRGLEVITDIDVSFRRPAQQLLEGVSAIRLSKLPQLIRTSHERKLLKLLISGNNWFPIKKIPQEHRRSQLVSPSRHVTVRNGETLGTMLGAVI